MVPAAAIDRLPVGVVIADENGFERYRNPAASVLAGTHAGLLLDAAIARHVDAARSGQLPEPELVDLYGPPAQQFEVSAERLDGGGAVSFVEDVTERHRIDRVRTDFVSNVSHELKTPISALAVLAETIAGEHDHEVIARLAERMIAETDRANRTISDLLELSRIEFEGLASSTTVDIRSLVAEVFDGLRHIADPHELRLVGPPADAAIPAVVGDRAQLFSALRNLVENAITYSERAGSVVVSVRAVERMLEIAVSDTGCGIAPRDHERVFERFYRADRARSRATGGTGLGLAIVRHVAVNHGGTISLSSVEGEGSRFTLSLPLVAESDR